MLSLVLVLVLLRVGVPLPPCLAATASRRQMPGLPSLRGLGVPLDHPNQPPLLAREEGQQL